MTASPQGGDIGYRASSGPHGGVVIVGDSLPFFSLDATMAALIHEGFGPICIDSGYGRGATPLTANLVSTGVDVIRRIAASDVDWGGSTVTWVVALGTNDVVYTNSSNASLVAATRIGMADAALPPTVTQRLWVDVRTERPSTQSAENAWNAVLVEGHTTIGWSDAVAASPWVYLVADQIHPTSAGVALRVQLVIDGLLHR